MKACNAQAGYHNGVDIAKNCVWVEDGDTISLTCIGCMDVVESMSVKEWYDRYR